MTKRPNEWRPQSAAETLRRIREGTDPWVAFGDFLDDWARTPRRERAGLVAEAVEVLDDAELRRWAALIAASVDWLCDRDELPAPDWIFDESWRLPEPWFLYPGWRLRAWQLIDTPAPLKMRNIFGGDRVFSRV